VVRILAYHDQIKIDWATLIEGPIKALLAQDVMSFLSHDKILDIWDRQLLDSNFRKTAAKDAYVFAATIRLHQDAASELLSLSGKDRMYSEPRTDNGRSPDPAFRVIWLPRKTFAEAALINQTTQQQSWLVRNGERLGIRVAEADASEVHTLHRPDVNYLDGTSVKSYKVGPMPWGTTKSSLQKVFNQWQWNARPGQPQGQAADGVFWTAQATQHPSHWVFTMAHGDVLISHNDAIKAAKTSIASSVIASTKTLKQLTAGPKKQTEGNTADPWLIHDPWAPYAKAPAPSLSNAQLAQMQTSIEQNIRESMTVPEDATMDAAADARVTALEDQVKQLTANVGQLTGTVNTINHQQHQLGTQVQKMKSHIDTQNASLHSMIDAKLEDQMSRIEALMSKRSKTSE
jgi:chaperonin cofactor prefoldin